MIICGELQSKHFKGWMGSFEHVQNTFYGDGVSNGRGSLPIQVQGVHLEGPSINFTSCASSL